MQETAASLGAFDRLPRTVSIRARFLEPAKNVDKTFAVKCAEFDERQLRAGGLLFSIRSVMAKDGTVIGICSIDFQGRKIRTSLRMRDGATAVFFPTAQRNYKGRLSDSSFPEDFQPFRERYRMPPWPADWAIGVSIKSQ